MSTRGVRLLKILIQGVLACLLLLVLAGRTVSANLSHDENKFVYAGQALADRGLLPYKDYPYDQMPYAGFFYAVSAAMSPFDFLAARLLSVLAWCGSLLVLLAILRLMRAGDEAAPRGLARFAAWLTPAVVVLIFLFDPTSGYVLESAKNNSFATLFSLLGFLWFARGVLGRTAAARAAFWSGLLVAVAGCTRLNYAGLLFVLGPAWLLFALTRERRLALPLLGWYTGGALAGGLPALALLALAPPQFYYANVVQLRLTTLYYQGILSHSNMLMAGKLATFMHELTARPVNLVLYGMLAAAAAAFLWGFIRRRSVLCLLGLAAAGSAAAMLLTAFMATPMMNHYLFAPLPFLLVVAALAAASLLQYNRWAYLAALAALLVTLCMRSTAGDMLLDVPRLLQPEAWVPLQVHAAAASLQTEHGLAPGSKVLALLPMVPAESGYGQYAFTASGSNSWRTSPLLSAQKRRLYGVTSPAELTAELEQAMPAAILTGFETPNPGFTFRDAGGLEQPFIDFAEQHGYQPQLLRAPFAETPITLWLRP